MNRITQKYKPSIKTEGQMQQNISNKSIIIGKSKKLRTQDTFSLLMLCMPAIILLLLLNYIPMFGLILSFKNYTYAKGIFGSDWVGLQNFSYLFLSNDAWRITRNTVVLNLLFIFGGLVASLASALLLNELLSKKMVKIYQTVLFFPFFLSWVVVQYACYAFLKPQVGILNVFLSSIGINAPSWYSEPVYWPVILLIASIWKSLGFGMLIYFAGLMGIESELYEAARIDGATRLQLAFKISIPLLMPLIITMMILSIGGIMRADFGMFWNLTMQSGALYPTTDVLDTYVYRVFRVSGQTGLSTAAGLYQSVVGFILVLTANKFVKKIDSESAIF